MYRSISPRLAIMIGERFPFPKIKTIISNFVLNNTQSLTNEPEAINYLATPENVSLNLVQLKYLLYWVPSTPPIALSLLNKHFNSHPYVTQYAISVLRSFPPDTIIFYIPQLVQALRYDQSGLVEKFIITSSKQSDVIAHQFIWNTQTYVNDGEKSSYPLSSKAKRIRQTIINSFTPASKENYENEFSFFEQVTAISGILKPHSKPEQRQILKSKLKEIQLKPKLYLPTNPDTTVIRINPDKASPMQSAAKVPILVTFLVSNVPALDDNDSSLNSESLLFPFSAQPLPSSSAADSSKSKQRKNSLAIIPPGSSSAASSASNSNPSIKDSSKKSTKARPKKPMRKKRKEKGNDNEQPSLDDKRAKDGADDKVLLRSVSALNMKSTPLLLEQAIEIKSISSFPLPPLSLPPLLLLSPSLGISFPYPPLPFPLSSPME